MQELLVLLLILLLLPVIFIISLLALSTDTSTQPIGAHPKRLADIPCGTGQGGKRSNWNEEKKIATFSAIFPANT